MKCAAGCERPATALKPVPLCTECVIKVIEEHLPIILSKVSEMISADTSVRIVNKMNPKDSRVLMQERLDSVLSSGQEIIRCAQFSDIPEQAGHSRTWAYLWLNEQVAKGVLTKTGSTYRVNRPREKKK